MSQSWYTEGERENQGHTNPYRLINFSSRNPPPKYINEGGQGGVNRSGVTTYCTSQGEGKGSVIRVQDAPLLFSRSW